MSCVHFSPEGSVMPPLWLENLKGHFAEMKTRSVSSLLVPLPHGHEAETFTLDVAV